MSQVKWTCNKLFSDALAEILLRRQTLCERERSILHTDPDIMSGVPVFIGTRVPLQTLFDYLEDEDGLSEFSEDFPHLKIPTIQVLESILGLRGSANDY
jgi:uncharacterized protein (DUF433 family)